MFLKITRSGPRTYLQLVEAYRDDAGKAKQRTVATLGRLDQIDSSLDSVISGLLKVTGRSQELVKPAEQPSLKFESARALGDVWALTDLWKELGFVELQRIFRRTQRTVDIEALVRVMVFNRLCDPESKLGVLRWLKTVALPDVDVGAVTHQQLLRSMDSLIEHQEAVDGVVAGLLRPLVDQDLSVVFYDLTTIRSDGLTQQAHDVRQFGMAKEGVIARQFMLGVVQTAEGLPIYHEVFDGNTAETKTLLPTLQKVLARFPTMRRVVLVADRGLLSLDNLEALQGLQLADGKPLEFILAVPGRRYHEFMGLLDPFQQRCVEATAEVIDEAKWNELRLVMAHDPVRAEEQHKKRRTTIETLESQAEVWAGKLEGQEAGEFKRGRRLSSSGAKARFFRAVSEAHLLKIIKVDLAGDQFNYDVDELALKQAELMDGKLLLVTNVGDLKAPEVIERYKSLADIERGFKVLKSELEIGPVFHRLPDRIRAHAMICFMALILHRVIRMRLRAAHTGISPERALETLKRIQHHRVSLDRGTPMTGVSSMTAEQTEVLHALKVTKPNDSRQLSLL